MMEGDSSRRAQSRSIVSRESCILEPAQHSQQGGLGGVTQSGFNGQTGTTVRVPEGGAAGALSLRYRLCGS